MRRAISSTPSEVEEPAARDHALGGGAGVTVALAPVLGVDQRLGAGLGVAQGRRGRRFGSSSSRGSVMLIAMRSCFWAASRSEAFEALGVEVGDEEGDAGPLGDAHEEVGRDGDVGAAAARRMVDEVAGHAQDVVLPFSRAQVELDAVGEGDEADLVVVAVGGEGEEGRDLGGELALGRRPWC